MTAVVIAYKLCRIEHLTFLNKMMVFYYSLDSMLGILESYYAFKLMRERYKVIRLFENYYQMLKVKS